MIHSTLTKIQHQKEINKMAKIVKDPAKQQQLEIDSTNAYVDKVASDVLGPLKKIHTIAKQTEDTTSPLVKATFAVDRTVRTMVANVKALNSDTTQTEDAVQLKQADMVEDSLTSSRNVVDASIRTLSGLVTEQQTKLFSNSVDESPRGLAILGNSQLLERIQKDPLGNMTNETVGNAVNAFRLYGLLGDADAQDNLATSLDSRFSKDTVDIIKSLQNQQAALQNIDNLLTTTHQRLITDADRIVSIRNRKVS